MLIIEGVRLGFLLAILAITLGFQALQPQFVNIEVVFPVFVLMAAAFTLNAIYLLFFETALKIWVPTAILFFFEAVFITALIHISGVNQSIFLFLYLVNIILCGFVFQRRGAMFLAIWTSILFSVLIILGPELKGQALFFAVGLNNLAFFAVAALSGFLSEQINFMGSALLAQGKDLKALRGLNALIIDNIASGLVTVDQHGTIVQANRAALEILDPIPRDIVGKSVDSVVPALSARLAAFGDALPSTASPPVARFDLNYVSPLDARQVLEVAVSALPNENEFQGFIITFQDLTRVRRLENQMRQSEKMAAVGQLAAGIAHEIRNPLASISGSVQLLGTSFKPQQEDEQRLMKIVMREIDRLNNLITEFLDFVRPDILKDDPIELNQLIRDVCDMLKMNANLRKEVRQDLDLQATVEIAGNRDKLKQALLNIIINAYQAMNEATDPVITITTESTDNVVTLKIKDRGSGMDEIGLRRMFEPFHTTKPKGTGLGLAVTHKILESHHAHVEVVSAKGVGTEFILEFPTRNERALDQNALADSELASENFSIAFRGQKRG